MPFDAEISAPSKTKLILQTARDRLALGWCQGIGWQGQNVCAVSAIMEGAGAHLPGWAAEDAALALGFRCVAGIVQWNDHPDRTQAEVLARFDDAIARVDHAV